MKSTLRLTPGMPIPFGGDGMTSVSTALAEAFEAGDSLVVMQDTGELLHVRGDVRSAAIKAVERAIDAFAQLSTVSDAAISEFFERFALKLAERHVWREIEDANTADVAASLADGRSTTRLKVSDPMRREHGRGTAGLAGRAERAGPGGRAGQA